MEKFKHSKEAKVKQKLKDGDIDIGGTFRIISKLDDAAKLHDKLKKKCHPDKFVGDKDKAEIANKLSQAINENKNNYYKLVELQQQAIKELNISIN
ncbi:MAG: hypothetical protein J6M30_04640 [Bacteroidales bacterium]|nr:hypothetical protein [Bacteroidales bacterium]